MEQSEAVDRSEPLSTVDKIEKLRLARTLYFHTAPFSILPSLRERGLFSKEDRGILDRRHLFYSLSFQSVYPEPSRYMRDYEGSFVLTIWRGGEHLDRQEGTRFYVPNFPLSSGEEPPAGYFEYREMGLRREEEKAGDFRKLTPEDFIASIEIDESLTETFLKLQLEFIHNLKSADEIEEEISAFLRARPEAVTIIAGYSLAELAHDLVAQIERQVSLYHSATFARKMLEADTNGEIRVGREEMLENGYQELLEKRRRVNEPASARLLDIWIQKMGDYLRQRNFRLDRKSDGNRKRFSPWLSSDDAARNLWSSMDMVGKAMEVATKNKLPGIY